MNQFSRFVGGLRRYAVYGLIETGPRIDTFLYQQLSRLHLLFVIRSVDDLCAELKGSGEIRYTVC